MSFLKKAYQNTLKKMPAGGNMAMLGVGASAWIAGQTYDPMKHDSRVGHIAKNIAADSVDLGVSLMLGGPIGLGLFAANLMGVPTISSLAMSAMDAVGESTDRKKYGRRIPGQNEQTMAMTRSQMGLIGQAGDTSMLGNEAMRMHN